jgi:hypothetical protein
MVRTLSFESLQSLDRALIVWIEGQRFLVIQVRQLFIASMHVQLGQRIVGVPILGEFFHLNFRTWIAS